MRKIDELLQRVPPDHFFHYTSPNGLLGIMQDQEIWVSSAYHLNDSREFRYATSLIIERLKERGKCEQGPNNQIYGRLLDDMSTLTSRVSVFVASFSEEGDLLSQWLAYSGAPNGYAVGFGPDHFSAAKEAGFQLVQSVYEKHEQVALADAVIDVLCEQFGFSEGGPIQHDLGKTLTAAAAMKHPGFSREAEWRLVKTIGAGLGLQNGLCFRQGRNGVVPYLKAPLASEREEFIPKSMHIGPSEDAEASRMAVCALLDSRGLLPSLGNRRVDVMVSKTPYRP